MDMGTPSMGSMDMATPSMGSMDMGTASPGSMDMGSTVTTDAVYFTIHNTGKQDDQLVSASSDVAGAVELHQSVMDNGVMTMKPIQSISVPAGGSVEFKPGGYHVMLIGMRRDLNVGDQFEVTLNFKVAGAVKVEVEVQQQ